MAFLLAFTGLKNILFRQVQEAFVLLVQNTFGSQVAVIIVRVKIVRIFGHTANVYISGRMDKLIVPDPHAHMDHPFGS